MNKNKKIKMIWEALYKPVQQAKKEMIYDAPQIEKYCEHCGELKEKCKGYKCWI